MLMGIGVGGCVCERERERKWVEAMEMKHVHEEKLSAETTPREEGQQASKEPKRGGWITFPFITGHSLSFSLSPPSGYVTYVGLNI